MLSCVGIHMHVRSNVPELHVWGFTWMSLSCVGVHMDVPELHVWGFTWMSLSCVGVMS